MEFLLNSTQANLKAFSRDGSWSMDQAKSPEETARSLAEDFESAMLTTMLKAMFEGVQLGGESGEQYESLLVEEYAATISSAGGIGVSDQIYRELLALQEAKSQS